MNEYIKSDLFRYYGDCSYSSLLKGIRNRTIRFQICFRLATSQGGGIKDFR